MSERRPLIIFRDHLLYPSETFILAQAESLERFIPYYVGSRRVPGLMTPLSRTIALNHGGRTGTVQEAMFKLFGYAPSLAERLRTINPALVHAHFSTGGTYALPLRRSLDIPLVVTFHGSDVTVKDRFLRYHVGHRVYQRRQHDLKRESSLFIAVSQFIREKLVDRGFPPNRTVVHYIGVDISKFQPDPLVRREPIVLFVGRLIEVKGCEYLIRALSVVQRSVPNVELVVIGDGPLRPSLENLASELLKRYRFLGQQPPDVVREWLNRAMVFSVPSIVDRTGAEEGFGLVFIEAQAMGVPVVSFSSGGIPEAVAHGESGFLAPQQDWGELAAYAIRLLTDSQMHQKFSNAGVERIKMMFDLNTQTRKLEELYIDIISSGYAITGIEQTV